MRKFFDIAVLLAFVLCIAVTLYLFVSLSSLLDIFLIAVGILFIIWGVYKLNSQIHLFKIKRAFRELDLRNARRKRRLPQRY